MFAIASLVLAAVALPAPPAFAAPVYEIEAEWVAPAPVQLRAGEVVTAEWRVNVNDDAPAPSNDPVDNVTATFTTDDGRFAGVPDSCLTADVTPVSSLSADGAVLTCNFGTHDMGTAITVQTPIVADGVTGDAVIATGAIGGAAASLPPIPIVTPFGMDINWTNPSATSTNAGTSTDFQFEWTLNLMKGSPAGPASVSYTIDIVPNPGASSTAIGCAPFSTAGAGSGHPWSGGSHPAEQMTNSVACSLTATATPNRYTLTLSGIDYTPANIPTLDSAGRPLPTDRDAIASGAVVFRVPTPGSGSVTLQSSAPTYVAAGLPGVTAQDDAANNSATKAFTTPGGWSSAFLPQSVGSSASAWSGQIQTSAGRSIAIQQHWLLHSGQPPTTVLQACSVYDTRWMTFQSHIARSVATGQPASFGTTWYYTGAAPSVNPASPSYDPQALAMNCDQDSGGWSTSPPADLSSVKATKLVFTAAEVAAYPSSSGGFTWFSHVALSPTAPAGTDIWKFDSIKVGTAGWSYDSVNVISPTPGLRYAGVNAFRDVVRIAAVAPFLQKSADRASVRPGEAATFTLSYAANGGPGSPLTVDGYAITDTLPLGLTFVPGSANPAPSVSTNGAGQQVLTWTLNGVATNQTHALMYQAVVGSNVTPGQTLQNTASATVAGQSFGPARSSVTVPTSGFTSIGKSADIAFIPNVAGDGVGAGSWTVTVRSSDPVSQAFTDTIDILPYNGDGRGTSFSGDYELTGVVAAPGATVYYTDAAPAALSDDPAAATNGSAGSIAGNTVGWSTTMPANPTAVRVIGPPLAPGATQQFTVEIETDGVEGGDVLVNRAQARTGHTELVMRTSAPITVANFYSASLKKYVQDADGNWRDANTVEDYPTYRVGDEVPYRIVITNTGQGTLTDLEITDTLFPEGSFTVDELAPGATQTHEFTVTLTGGGSVVNTACGAAAIPDDSGVAPTINCDPAGVEVVNYAVEKAAAPAAGTVRHPGDEVTYTVTVTQEGTAPAVAAFSDDLAEVLDDADLTAGPTASVGTASITDGVLSWSGTVPVGQVATVTYTVTVKDAAAVATDGDYLLVNGVTSPGCPDAGCPPLEHPVADFSVVKTSDPVDGSNVDEGDTIEYTLTVSQVGEAAYVGASLVDDLGDVLDDATWVGDAVASAGTIGFDAATQTLTWAGDLAVGDVVTITYSVTVTGAGDTRLYNAVTSDGCTTTASCETEHYTASYTTVKTADPASGSDVQVGDVIEYTVTVTQSGLGRVVGQFFNDDLANVLDDATFNNDIVASAGTFTFVDGVIAWTGDLGPGDVATVTYSVTVTAAGDTLIGNTVRSPGCETAADCETEHLTGRYETFKTSDPVTGSDVQIGDTIEYTVTVSHVGEAAVEDASLSDDLTAVLDDATWNDDLAESAGTAGYTEPSVTWTGDLAVDQVVTVTYSVTVTGAGDMTLTNVVTSDGCIDAASCTTTHQTGDYTVAKTSTPAPGSDVAVGDTITYTVTVAQRGPGAVTAASFEDDLSAVLDDATWDDELTATAGAASFDSAADSLTWTGDLPVAAVVTVTYSVTVTGAGDMTLTNVVAPGEHGECVPAADGNPDCTTTHETGRFEFAKMADPVHDSDVQAGDTITYTVTVTQVGPAGVTASLVDDLSDVLDDATYNEDVAATAGAAGVDGPTLSWSGVLAPGDEVTITYSVTVTGAGNTTLANVVTSESPAGSCVAAADGTEECRTIHKTGGYVFAKTADPASGTTVRTGDTVTYTISITQRGEGVVTDAVVTDDLSGVLDDATWNGNQAATAGAVVRDGNTLTWTGDLAVDQTVTVTYSVTVTATGPATLRNAVTSPDDRAICDPAGVCVTTHDIPAPPPLAVTGGTMSWAAAALGGLLLIVGAVAFLSHRRRFPRASGGPTR